MIVEEVSFSSIGNYEVTFTFEGRDLSHFWNILLAQSRQRGDMVASRGIILEEVFLGHAGFCHQQERELSAHHYPRGSMDERSFHEDQNEGGCVDNEKSINPRNPKYTRENEKEIEETLVTWKSSRCKVNFQNFQHHLLLSWKETCRFPIKIHKEEGAILSQISLKEKEFILSNCASGQKDKGMPRMSFIFKVFICLEPIKLNPY